MSAPSEAAQSQETPAPDVDLESLRERYALERDRRIRPE